MKKLLFIGMLAIIAFTGASAQTAMINPNGLAIDTASQAAAEGPSLRVPSYQASLSIVVLFTKISGTVTGSVSWQGSNDGTNYYTIDTDTLTDATNRYSYIEDVKKYLHYRALITQTGTSSGSYKATLYTTKPQ